MTRSFRARVQKSLKRLPTLAAAAVLAVPLLASPAYAASWKVIGTSGFVTHSTTDLRLVFPATGAVITCIGHDMDGLVDNVANPSGQNLITIDSHITMNCTGPFGLMLALTFRSTWSYNAIAPTSDPDVHIVSLTNVDVGITTPACSMRISGGIPGTYNNRTNILSLTPTAPNPDNLSLTVSAATCPGVARNGDPVHWYADYEAFPPYTLEYTP